MKLLFICLFISCQLFGQSHKDTLEVNKLLDQWHIDVANADFNAYFGKMADNFVFVGTDVTEVWTKQTFADFSKPYFKNKQTWTFKAIKRNIYFSEENKIAWFDEVLNTWMGLCRGSGVLIKKNNQWLINHYVLSVTVQNENINEVIEIKHKKDSLIIKTLNNN